MSEIRRIPRHFVLSSYSNGAPEDEPYSNLQTIPDTTEQMEFDISSATQVGHQLALIGDEFNRRYHRTLEETLLHLARVVAINVFQTWNVIKSVIRSFGNVLNKNWTKRILGHGGWPAAATQRSTTCGDRAEGASVAARGRPEAPPPDPAQAPAPPHFRLLVVELLHGGQGGDEHGGLAVLGAVQRVPRPLQAEGEQVVAQHLLGQAVHVPHAGVPLQPAAHPHELAALPGEEQHRALPGAPPLPPRRRRARLLGLHRALQEVAQGRRPVPSAGAGAAPPPRSAAEAAAPAAATKPPWRRGPAAHGRRPRTGVATGTGRSPPAAAAGPGAGRGDGKGGSEGGSEGGREVDRAAPALAAPSPARRPRPRRARRREPAPGRGSPREPGGGASLPRQSRRDWRWQSAERRRFAVTMDSVPAWAPAVGFTLLPHAGGFLGSSIAKKEIPLWYKTLRKPSWCPPNWVFAPVWGTLYTSMGYGSYLVWKELGGFNEKAVIPLGLYAGNLALNWAWTPIFFGAHKMGWGLVTLLLTTGAATATTASWYSINKKAAYLMVPYLAWLSLASALNYRIWKDNCNKKKPE